MRLDFTNANGHFSGNLVVAVNQDALVEIYLKDNQDDTHTLIALSGVGPSDADKCIRQGPYTTLAQARAAQTAICNELLKIPGIIQWRGNGMARV